MVKNRRFERPIAVPTEILDSHATGNISAVSVCVYMYLCFLSRGDIGFDDFESINADSGVIESIAEITNHTKPLVRESLLELQENGWIELENISSNYSACVTVHNQPVESRDTTFTPDGFVYLAYCETGHYKIGRSKNPGDRIRHFDTQMPVEVTTIHTFPAESYRYAEEELQSECTEFHEKGEWYSLPQKYVDAIKRVEKYQDDFYHSEDSKVISIKDLI